MNVVAAFLHPALIAAGAAAAAVPIVIHLLNRRRVRLQQWAAMAWLLAALKKQQRRLKMENWLILALRCAALVLLGSALARWVVSDSALAALARPRRSVVLLLDTSYSTAARSGARSVSDRVREVADRILGSLSADDVVAVVVSNDVRADRSGTRPALLLPRSVGKEGGARGRLALTAMRPTEAPAPWPDALVACAPHTLLQPADTNRVLVWVTDLQARDWRAPGGRGGADPLRDALEGLRREGVSIEVADVGGGGGGSLPNLVVSDVALSDDTDLFAGRGFQVRATVKNEGTRTVERATLRVFLDDSPSPVKTVVVPTMPAADATTLAARPIVVPVDVPRDAAPKTAGAHALRVEISPPEGDATADALGLDSRRVLSLDVRVRLRIVAWVEAPARARFDPSELLRGLFVGEGAGDQFEFDAVRSEDELARALSDASRPPAFVVLADSVPRGAATQRDLAAWVRAGGALAVFSGADFDETLWNAGFHGASAPALLPFRFGPRESRDVRERPWTLDFGREGAHPMSKAFVSGPARFVKDGPIAFYGRTRLVPADALPAPTGTAPPATPPSDDLVVLRFREGDGAVPGAPAIAEGPVGFGRVLYAGFALDDFWSPESFVLFTPVLLNDAALGMTRDASAGRNLLVGGVLRTSLPLDATNARLSIPGRGEETLVVRAAATERERPEVSYDRVGTSGVWRLTYERPPDRGAATAAAPRKAEQAFGVNPDPAEGSLLRATHAEVVNRVPGAQLKIAGDLEGEAAIVAPSRQGELTSWLFVLVLAFLLVEPYLAMRFGRHGAKAPAPAPTPGGAS